MAAGLQHDLLLHVVQEGSPPVIHSSRLPQTRMHAAACREPPSGVEQSAFSWPPEGIRPPLAAQHKGEPSAIGVQSTGLLRQLLTSLSVVFPAEGRGLRNRILLDMHTRGVVPNSYRVWAHFHRPPKLVAGILVFWKSRNCASVNGLQDRRPGRAAQLSHSFHLAY